MANAIEFPQNLKPEALKLRAVDVVGVNTSVFTGQQEIQVHQGQWWELSLKFPPLDRSQSQTLIAFMLKLGGPAGTFRIHDPSACQPMGRARGKPVVSTVPSPRQSSLLTSGWSPKVSYQLEAGDYIEINGHLYKTLDTVSSDSAGNATLTLWPRIREAYPSGTTLVIRNPRGTFRMQHSAEWQVDFNHTYAFILNAREAL